MTDLTPQLSDDFVELEDLTWTEESLRHFDEMACAMLGEKYWNAHRVPILIQERDEINGAYYPEQNCIVLTRGMINACQNEDQLAWILAHELGHFMRTMKYGKNHQNSKQEEAAADYEAVERLSKAGYKITESTAILRILFTDEMVGYKWFEHIDVHPLKEQRFEENELAVTRVRRRLRRQDINADTVPTRPIPDYILNVPTRKKWLAARLERDHFQEKSQSEQFLYLRDLCQEIARVKNDTLFNSRWKDFEEFFKKYEKDLPAEERTESYNGEWTGPRRELIDLFTRQAFAENLTKREVTCLASCMGKISLSSTPQGEVKTQIKKFQEMIQEARENNTPLDLVDVTKRHFILYKWLPQKTYDPSYKKTATFEIGQIFSVTSAEEARQNVYGGLFKEMDELKDDYALIFRREVYSDYLVLKEIDNHHLEIVAEKSYSDLMALLDQRGYSKMAKALANLHSLVDDIAHGKDDHFTLAQLDDLKRRIAPDLTDYSNDEFSFKKPWFKDKEESIAYIQASWYPEGKSLPPLAIKDHLYYRRIQRDDNNPQDNVDNEEFFNEYDFFSLQNHPFSSDQLLKCMSPEEQEFWKTYNAEANKVVWDAFLAKMIQQLKDGTLDCFPKILQNRTSRGCRMPLEGTAARAHLSYDESCSLIKAFVENAPKTEDFLLYHTDGFSEFLIQTVRMKYEIDNSVKIPELDSVIDYFQKCLNLKIPKNVDIFDYLEKEVRKYDTASDAEEDKASRRLFFLDSLISLYALKQGHDIPTKVFKTLLSRRTTIAKKHKDQDNFFTEGHMSKENMFGDTVIEDIYNKEAWPMDLLGFVEFFMIDSPNRYSKDADYDLRSKNQTEDDKRLQQFSKNLRTHWCSLLDKETDVDKIQEAWEHAGWINEMIFDRTLVKVYDKYSDKYLVHSPMWDRSRPLEKRMHVFFAIGARKAFPSDGKAYHQLITDILDDIQKIEDPKLREEYAFKFVELKIADPKVRNYAETIWANSVGDILGPDDDSEEYFDAACVFVDKIQKKIRSKHDDNGSPRYFFPYTYRYSLGDKLAKALVSQGPLSAELEPAGIDLMSLDNKESFYATAGIFLEGISGRLLEGKPDRVHAIIDFLRSQGTRSDCQKMAQTVVKWSKIKSDPDPYAFDMMYQQFWTLAPELQGAILNKIMSDGIVRKNRTEKLSFQDRWKENFDYVVGEMFGQKEDKTESQQNILSLAREFMWEYISARPESERNLCLGTLLASAGKKGTDANQQDFEASIGKGVKSFLEGIAPAGIKLGQALSALPITPDYIRAPLRHFTSHALEPPRWEIFAWKDQYRKECLKANRPEEAAKLPKNLGKILGSASYNVAIELFEEIFKCLRIGAATSADAEMGYIETALSRLIERGFLKGHGETFKRVVAQARAAIKIETDVSGAGYEQLQKAKEIYPSSVSMDGYDFELRIADWHDKGKKWVKMERMPGKEFDDIPEGPYKQALKKAYLGVELLNILSGREFDHDRHKGQMLIEKKNDTTSVIGLFDTGSMALNPPSVEDQKALGRLMYKVTEHYLREPESSLANILSYEFDEYYKENPNASTYITEVQRGLTAMGPYYENFTAKEWMDCCSIVFNAEEMPISSHVLDGFTHEILNSTGIFTASKNWTTQEKENLGRFLFRAYATSLVHPDQDLQTVVRNEAANTPDADLGLLGRFLKKKKLNTSGLTLEIPAQFMNHVCALFKNEDIDILVAKGITKAAYESVNISNLQGRGTPEERKQIGALLYKTAVYDKSKEEKMEFLKGQLFQLAQTSDLARDMHAVLTVASQVNNDEDSGEALSVIMDHLLTHGIDPDIKAGIESVATGISGAIFVKALNAGLNSALMRSLIRKFMPRAKSEKGPHKTLEELLDMAAKRLVAQPRKLAAKLEQGDESTPLVRSIRKHIAKPSTAIKFKKPQKQPK